MKSKIVLLAAAVMLCAGAQLSAKTLSKAEIASIIAEAKSTSGSTADAIAAAVKANPSSAAAIVKAAVTEFPAMANAIVTASIKAAPAVAANITSGAVQGLVATKASAATVKDLVTAAETTTASSGGSAGAVFIAAKAADPAVPFTAPSLAGESTFIGQPQVVAQITPPAPPVPVNLGALNPSPN